MAKFLHRAFFLTVAASTIFSGANAQMESATDPTNGEEVIDRLEALAQRGGLPTYEDLRLPVGEIDVSGRYLKTVPLLEGDLVTTSVVFADVPEDSQFALLGLNDLIAIGLGNNFDVINSQRSVEIARSQTIVEEYFFVPFVDLYGSSRVSGTNNPNSPSSTRPGKETGRDTLAWTNELGIDATQNLPTGGSVTANIAERRTQSRTESGDGTVSSKVYSADASVRFLQPLLRGSGLLTGDGTEIGTASLRQSRLSEMDRLLQDRLLQRDTAQDIIRIYFQILQVKQQLLVSRDAIKERYRFLDETRIKYDVGRVAESEILRAEIQFLQELETAINRQEQLDTSRETLLLRLGLPLDTPISIIDITPLLKDRGRIEIPTVNEAITMAMNNRIELMRSDISVEQSEISETVSRNDVLPQLDFDAGYGRDDSGSRFTDANDFDNSSWDAGVTLRVPLINVRRREAHKQSMLRLEQAETNRLSLERNIDQEVRRSHRGVLATEANLTILRKTVEQARRNLELIKGSFEVGFSTITEVRLAQDDLFASETRYNNALLNYQLDIADLYIALGLPLR